MKAWEKWWNGEIDRAVQMFFDYRSLDADKVWPENLYLCFRQGVPNSRGALYFRAASEPLSADCQLAAGYPFVGDWPRDLLTARVRQISSKLPILDPLCSSQ